MSLVKKSIRRELLHWSSDLTNKLSPMVRVLKAVVLGSAYFETTYLTIIKFILKLLCHTNLTFGYFVLVFKLRSHRASIIVQNMESEIDYRTAINISLVLLNQVLSHYI
jgi:hypothetical protein